jgi:hypothetical protein
LINRALCFEVLAVFALVETLAGQEKPLQVSATLSTGYYSTYTRSEANQTVTFVPADAQFNVNGYFLSPDFLSFSAQPELTSGPQASDAGFQGGNGVQLRVTALRNRAFPLTFRYANVRREDVYFGSLSQVSAYSLRSRTHDLGLTWEVKPTGLPSTTIDWGVNSVDSKSDIALIPDYLSHVSHVNVDSHYERWGWNLDGFAHHQQVQSDLLTPLSVGTATSALQQTVTQYQGAAQHDLFRDSSIFIAGGAESTSSILLGLPLQLSTRFANANLRLFQKRRWKASLRASYSSNLATQLLSQLLTGLAGIGPGTIAPDSSALVPLEQKIANISLNGMTSVDLTHGWGLYGSVDQNSILASSQQSPLNASFFTTAVGVTYATAVAWGRFSGQYARDFGQGSVTGQSGIIQGQSYMASLEQGTPDKLRFDMSLHGMTETVSNIQPIYTDSYSAEASVARRVVGSFSVRLGGGYQWGVFENAANQFRTDGYTARADLEHPRIQINAAINNTLGNALPLYSAVLIGIPTASLLTAPLQTVPSDFRSMSFTVHTNPTRKLEISGTYTRSLQHLDGVLNNYFELMSARLLYHYRRIQIEGGYIRSNQIFASYPDTRRGQTYVRVSRNLKVL